MPINLTSSRSAAGRSPAARPSPRSLFATARRRPTPKPEIGHFTLANGLEVVVVPDHRAPVVTHMVWYKVGAADETPGKSGLAHFLEHLMFKGTAKNPVGRFSQDGGDRRRPGERLHHPATTPAISSASSRENLKTLMEFEADRMTGLVLTDDVGGARAQGRARGAATSASPTIRGARLAEQIEAALYLNHPYGRPVIGWRHEIEKLNREDALAFYRRFYTPNNAVLVVAGDVTADEVKTLAEATYGKVAAGRRDRRRAQRPQEPAQVAARHVTLADPRVEQPSLQRAYLVPSSTTAKAGEAEALEVLSLHSRPRHHQPALPHARGRARARGQRRRLVQRHRARRHAVRRLRLAEAGRHACRSSRTPSTP